jgi:hypothetical protein
MSRRLIGSVLRDLRIQLRHGYPWIAALAALACIAAFAQIPQGNSDRVAPYASLAFSFFRSCSCRWPGKGGTAPWPCST